MNRISLKLGLRVPVADGESLSANLYLPTDSAGPLPLILVITPYVAQFWHQIGKYFAERGFLFAAVDSRGRGNSSGEFFPFVNEAQDGYDVVEWFARQTYCDGRVVMWGGSYSGYNQWAIASKRPPALAAIAPAASVYPGYDFPMRRDVGWPYAMQWLTLVAGRTLQSEIFEDQEFWNSIFAERFTANKTSMLDLDSEIGVDSPILKQWLSYPVYGPYWESQNPSTAELSDMQIPVLTITGHYDADQHGALRHYQRHVDTVPARVADSHHLVIGPWDHAGTRFPQQVFAGIDAGEESLLDLKALHLDWYQWVLGAGSRPDFLRKRVAYYLMGSNEWRYADSLSEITTNHLRCSLGKRAGPGEVKNPYDFIPRGFSELPVTYSVRAADNRIADIERRQNPNHLVHGNSSFEDRPQQVVFDCHALTHDLEVVGFFVLNLWASVQGPENGLHVAIYDVDPEGEAVLLAADWRGRSAKRDESKAESDAPKLYTFDRFNFIAKRIRRGNNLRLVIGSMKSIHHCENGYVDAFLPQERYDPATETTVTLFSNDGDPSTLLIPISKAA